ncbi:hypothetical protein [Methanoculleus sp. 7T]|uniref:hypothetical protein n=1 Tax=Methanoculleus sp. 7T TaxID=2937282 RepID=UPI0020BE511E|nr:hypothetical protein [Methanoculleus sp. 7T]MCK8519420.1 hypothetical protein [Methanoculleus sp. 7T]
MNIGGGVESICEYRWRCAHDLRRPDPNARWCTSSLRVDIPEENRACRGRGVIADEEEILKDIKRGFSAV